MNPTHGMIEVRHTDGTHVLYTPTAYQSRGRHLGPVVRVIPSRTRPPVRTVVR